MASIGDLISGPVGQLLLTLFGGQQQRRAQREATAANRARQERIEGMQADLRERVLGGFEGSTQDEADQLARAFDEIMRESESSGTAEIDRRRGELGIGTNEVNAYIEDLMKSVSDTGSDYDQILGTGRDLLSQVSGQEETDTREAFQSQLSSLLGDLESRGLGSTGVSTSVERGVGRDLQGELNRISDRRLRERLGLETDIGSQRALALERGRDTLNRGRAGRLDFLQGLREAILNAQTQMEGRRFGITEARELGGLDQLTRANADRRALDIGLTGDETGFLERITDAYPEQNVWLQLANQFGQNAVEEPDEPSSFESFFQGAAPGIGAGAGAVTAKALFFCIDGTALLETPEGKKSLADIKIGDAVLCQDYSFHDVLDKDYGKPEEDRLDEFVKVTKGEHTLIATIDHVIDGKEAWDHDSAVHCEAVPCGDIKVEGGLPYFANGFAVTSNFAMD